MKAYRVRWDNSEGIRQERYFSRLSDAKAEAEELRKRFDYVAVEKIANTTNEKRR